MRDTEQHSGGEMKLEYKTVIVRSLKTLRYAELLKRHGWIVGSVGTETVLFYRKVAK